MKFCKNCGTQMSDDAKFCSNCATMVDNSPTESVTPQPQSIPNESIPSVEKKSGIRPGMKAWMIVFFIHAGIFSLLSLLETSLIAFFFSFGIVGVMFLLLGLSPKGSKCMFGKTTGLTKGWFVAICLAAAVMTMVVMGNSMEPTSTGGGSGTNDSQNTDVSNSNNDIDIDNSNTNTENEQEGKTTLADVKKWYDNQVPAVSQSLMEYAKSVNGLTGLNVDSSKFRFGEDSGWYDCHYTFYFTCKVNGVTHTGEARAFMEYETNTISWFHFEIFSNNSIQSVVEHYDDSYDQIIEDYYKKLVNQYN